MAVVVERGEREEAIAGGLLTGRRSWNGRELVAQFEARIATAERNLEVAVRRERERAMERDAARATAREAEPGDRTAGVIEGLRLAGRAMGAILNRLAAVSVERYPLLGQLLAACEWGDAAGVELLDLDDEAPAQGPRPRARPSLER